MQTNEKKESLSDYKDFFEENLTGEEIKSIAEMCECSVSTVYTYIGGKMSNIHLAKAIMEAGIKLLSFRGLLKQDFI